MLEKLKKVNLKSLVLGIFVGVLIFAGVRFVTYSPPAHTHYHANFAVFVDGQQEKFDNPFYYEEVTACDLDADNKPEHRTHMHDNKAGLIHVHADAVTWGNFFQNIGWNIGDGYIDNGKKLIVNEGDKKVNFVLNGKKTNDIATKVIGNTDKLLISYGNESESQLNQLVESVPSNAKEANETQDPASCSGNQKENNFKDRLNNIL
jgi:predicted lactoylglutathione lyase